MLISTMLTIFLASICDQSDDYQSIIPHWPCCPGAPSLPAVPFSPALPCLPGIPGSPWSPWSPFGPFLPCLPSSPGEPSLPSLPGGPVPPGRPGSPRSPCNIHAPLNQTHKRMIRKYINYQTLSQGDPNYYPTQLFRNSEYACCLLSAPNQRWVCLWSLVLLLEKYCKYGWGKLNKLKRLIIDDNTYWLTISTISSILSILTIPSWLTSGTLLTILTSWSTLSFHSGGSNWAGPSFLT